MRTSRTFGIVLSAAIIALLTLSATAYKTQKGYVKTRGRYTSQGTLVPGKPLSNAVVMIRNSNSTRSDAKGNFSVTLPEQNFYLQNVKKDGYILSDPDVLKRRYSCSAGPLVLVLETPQQQADDRLASEKKLRRTLQRKLQAKEDELEALKEENKITTEEYRNALQELYKLQETNEKFISEMAERYSRIDFDELDDFQRQIAAYIQDGELARADSLLNTKGSMDDREAEINRLREANTQRREEIAKEQQELEASENLAAAKLADFGADCYNRFQISRLELKNDSAAYWLERRANADTTDIDWQLDAGLFLSDYLADYDKALRYYQTALDHSIKTNGEQSLTTALIYNNIGTTLGQQGRYAEGQKYLKQAIKILEAIGLDKGSHMLTVLSNLANSYNLLGDYDKSLEMQTKVLIMRLALLGNRHPDVARSYLNLGNDYYMRQEYSEALDCYKKALDVAQASKINDGLLLAAIHDNLGLAYGAEEAYGEALNHLSTALELKQSELDDRHPQIAKSYNNLGGLMIFTEDYSKARDYFTRAARILDKPIYRYIKDMATTINGLGMIDSIEGNYESALSNYEKALEILSASFPSNHPYILSLQRRINELKSKTTSQQ